MNHNLMPILCRFLWPLCINLQLKKLTLEPYAGPQVASSEPVGDLWSHQESCPVGWGHTLTGRQRPDSPNPSQQKDSIDKIEEPLLILTTII